ncbi:MAG TPA: 16S rRNA (guanine(966)-N(2))-methyltransferase RsmD [Rhodospirillaceae bacterium]|nr:16S rRNA (guanine(966)-N(2))-methyltransferase RsmD [Rhodospirillaceae bacterium]
MRIIAGRHRGRVLAAPDGSTTRPTADRVREALFNILAHGRMDLRGSLVLDAFAGSGSLGFEALSRGAGHVFFMESEANALAIIAGNARKLGVAGEVTLLAANVLSPPTARQACDLLLLDPPYKSGLGHLALPALAAAGWLAAQSLVVVEVAAGEGYKSPLADFVISDERRYGAARLVFLQQKT